MADAVAHAEPARALEHLLVAAVALPREQEVEARVVHRRERLDQREVVLLRPHVRGVHDVARGQPSRCATSASACDGSGVKRPWSIPRWIASTRAGSRPDALDQRSPAMYSLTAITRVAFRAAPSYA